MSVPISLTTADLSATAIFRLRLIRPAVGTTLAHKTGAGTGATHVLSWRHNQLIAFHQLQQTLYLNCHSSASYTVAAIELT